MKRLFVSFNLQNSQEEVKVEETKVSAFLKDEDDNFDDLEDNSDSEDEISVSHGNKVYSVWICWRLSKLLASFLFGHFFFSNINIHVAFS